MKIILQSEPGNRQDIRHKSLSAEKRKQILDEYIHMIDRSGKKNHFSLSWLCHPMSEKNDLEPDHLLYQILDFLDFVEKVRQNNGDEMVFVTGDRFLMENIGEYAGQHNWVCTGFKRPGSLSRMAGGMRRFLRECVNLVSGYFAAQWSQLKTRSLWEKVDEEKKYTVFRTWFDSRSAALIQKDRDIYFGGLPGYFRENGCNVLYFGGFMEGFEGELKTLKGIVRNPVIVVDSLISGCDFIRSFWFRLMMRRRIQLPETIKIDGTDVTHVVTAYFRRHLRNPNIESNYRYFLSMKKLTGRIRMEHLMHPFENYSWEKLTQLAVRQSGDDIPVTSFQHAQVARSSVKFMVGPYEADAFHFPRKIVTLGEVTADYLVRHMGYPKKRVVTGCALRQDYQADQAVLTRKKRKRILVQLWSFGRSIDILRFVYESGIYTRGFRVSVNTHPCHRIEKLEPYLDFDVHQVFRVNRENFHQSFETSDLLIYHGSTASLDAMARGLPVIHINLEEWISSDPLFQFGEFKWEVHHPSELEPVVEEIFHLDDETYYNKQKMGLAFVRRYCYSVNEQHLKHFNKGC